MMKIHEALAAVMVDVTAVGKHDKNTHQNFAFRGIDAVLNVVGPAFRRHGIVVMPDVRTVERRDVEVGNKRTAMRETAEFDAPNSGTQCPVTLSPDGRWLLSTNESENRIWRLKGLPEKRVLAGHGKHVPKNTFSHDGRLLATASKTRFFTVSVSITMVAGVPIKSKATVAVDTAQVA